MMEGKHVRLVRMLVQVRPHQVGQRLRLRAYRAALDRQVPWLHQVLLSGPGPETAVAWPAAFTPLDARTWQDCLDGHRLRRGELALLGLTRQVAPPGPGGAAHWEHADWEMAGEPLLWRFHLYYWDWAWVLTTQAPPAEARATFASIWRSWHSAIAPGQGPAWLPYPAALRAWSFCGLYGHLVADGPVEAPFRAELAAHAGFLRRNLETDVGGNHLIKNLKALVGLAVFFADNALLNGSMRRLDQQLAVQVLADGGHYERAPAYHCQVLADLMDIAGLLRAAQRGVPARLSEAIAAMCGWLGCVLTPAGTVPLLNDGFPVHPALLSQMPRQYRPPARCTCCAIRAWPGSPRDGGMCSPT